MGLGNSDIRAIETKTIGTAKAGTSLSVLGETREPLRLRIKQTGQELRFRPVVVKGLSMDVNFSGPWLRAHHWDHLHSKGCLQINQEQVRLEPYEQKKPSATYSAYLKTSTLLPAGSAAILAIELRDAKGVGPGKALGILAPGNALSPEGREELVSTRGLVTVNEHSDSKMVVLNSGESDVMMPRGKKLATFSEAEVV